MFFFIPITAVIVIPLALDSNGLPKLISLIVGVLFILYKKKFLISQINIKAKDPVTLYLLLIFTYISIQIIQPQDWNQFILGSYTRLGGLISLICFAILLNITRVMDEKDLEKFEYVISKTFYIFLFVATLDKLNWLPYEGSKKEFSVTVNMGNPNFASALLGILISAHIVQFMYIAKNRKWIDISLICYSFVVLYWIGSLQGLFIVFVSVLILVLKKYIDIKNRNLKIKLAILNTGLLALLVVTFFVSNFSDFLVQAGSVKQRLAYWKLSLVIFRDNPILGVGLDNLRSRVTQNRDLALVKQEGMFTIPDRSHNVVIDHFVQGGFLAGSFWLIFVFLVSVQAIKVLKNIDFNSNFKNDLTICLVWFGYVFQSSISVDHILLTTLGVMSAGFILGKSHNVLVTKTRKIDKTKLGYRFFFIVALLSGSLLLTVAYFPAELNAFKFLRAGDSSKINSLYKSRFIQSQTVEEVAVAISKSKQFNTANQFADRLLKRRSYSHQAMFIKSVYAESTGDNLEALKWMKLANEVDPWNTVYILSLGILEFNLGNKEAAQGYLDKTIEINPDQIGIEELRSRLQVQP